MDVGGVWVGWVRFEFQMSWVEFEFGLGYDLFGVDLAFSGGANLVFHLKFFGRFS